MMQAVYHQFTDTQVKYSFYCRNEAEWTTNIINDIQEQINLFCELRFTEDELYYLRNLPFIKDDFIEFLRLYKPDRNHIQINQHYFDGLEIKIGGPWLLTILFEVPILAIVNEVYFKHKTEKLYSENKYIDTMLSASKNLKQKRETIRNVGLPVADFGTRRRFNLAWHREVVETLKDLPTFVGTSNVMLAMINGIKPIGTVAHEWYMAGAGMNVQLENSQSYMLQKWADEYRGDLGIALTDTYGVNKFCKDFDLYFAKLYDGVRHDSGDPIVWAFKMLKHYEELGIDPKTKTLVFSDGLTIAKAKEIYNLVKDFTNVSFGIGTHLTNDFPSHTPLNIVIKMTECNGKPTAKLSDEPGKEMCEDKEFLTYLKSVMEKKQIF